MRYQLSLKLPYSIRAAKLSLETSGRAVNSSYMNKKFIIDTNNAPRAIGPYSQAVGYNGLLFVSGQIPVDPATGDVNKGGIEAQTRQAMNNLQAVLMAAGLDFSHVLKVTLYLRNMNDYDLVNDVYSLFFDHSPPARVCVEVSRLPQDVLVEIDCIAAAPTDYESRVRGDEPEDSDTPTDHPGPDDWEAQHMAEAEEAHREALANAQKADALEDEPQEDAGDGDEEAPALQGDDEPPSTTELSVEDLEEPSDAEDESDAPPLPSSKIKLPKPPTKPGKD